MPVNCNDSQICRAFQWRARWTWNRLSNVNEINKLMPGRLLFGEPTVTESNLLYLAEQKFSNLRIDCYTTNQEGANGADFAMYFNSPGMKVTIVFQAKRLYPPDGKKGASYPEVKASQLSKLLSFAKSEGFVPLYLFYNSDDFDPQKHHRCSPCSDCRQPLGNVWGCSIATLDAVIRAGNGPEASMLHPMFPWHVIFNPSYLRNIAPAMSIAAGKPIISELKNGNSLAAVVSRSLLTMHLLAMETDSEKSDNVREIVEFCDVKNHEPQWFTELKFGSKPTERFVKSERLDRFLKKTGISHVVHIEEQHEGSTHHGG